MTWIDLAHPIHSGIFHWPGDPPTRPELWSTMEKDGCFLQAWTIGEHTGTHLGAPLHYRTDGMDCASIPPSRLLPIGVRLDVRTKVAENPDYLAQPEDARKISERMQNFSKPVLVMVCTGWDQKWLHANDYLGRRNGDMHFPGIALETIEYLAQHSCVVGVGIDTAGVDGGQNTEFSVGKRCAELGWYHIENMTGLGRIPDICPLFIGILPFVGGAGSPCRVLALADDSVE